jgi:hypothetical protein
MPTFEGLASSLTQSGESPARRFTWPEKPEKGSPQVRKTPAGFAAGGPAMCVACDSAVNQAPAKRICLK